jgi:tight adherence protein B
VPALGGLVLVGAASGWWWLVPPALVAGFLADRVLGRWRVRRARAERRQMVLEVCDAVAAELRAGMPTDVAVAHATQGWPELEPVAATSRLGGDLPSALHQAARQPGASGLDAMAASWEVSTRSGAPLADVLDRVAAGLRDDEEALAEVTAALGPPRATAKMLAVLPVLGVGLGMSMGADPLAFLLGSPLGLGCLGLGVLLALVGLWWVEQLAAAVED